MRSFLQIFVVGLSAQSLGPHGNVENLYIKYNAEIWKSFGMILSVPNFDVLDNQAVRRLPD